MDRTHRQITVKPSTTSSGLRKLIVDIAAACGRRWRMDRYSFRRLFTAAAALAEAQRRAAARLPHVEHALSDGHERVDRAVVVDLGDELLGWGQG